MLEFLLILTITIVAASLILCHALQRSIPCGQRVLVVIAHPDDETMFFAPTLCGLRKSGVTVYVLCVCSGNAFGLGIQRKRELAKALGVYGISTSNLVILDHERLPDGFVTWPKEHLANTLLKELSTLDVSTVLTFDDHGVSSHPNHIACFRALQFLYTNGLIPPDVQVFTLETVPLWRKYMIPVDAIISAFHSTFLYVSPPLNYVKAWRAMFAHKSQLVWFRYLYMIFSRYLLINTFKRIHIQQRHPIQKRR